MANAWPINRTKIAGRLDRVISQLGDGLAGATPAIREIVLKILAKYLLANPKVSQVKREYDDYDTGRCNDLS